MTITMAVLGLVGGFLALFGAAIQAQAAWIRTNGGCTVSAATALGWMGRNATRVLWHAVSLRDRRGRSPLPVSVQEAGGVALGFFGAFIAAAGLYIALVAELAR